MQLRTALLPQFQARAHYYILQVVSFNDLHDTKNKTHVKQNV